MNNEEKNIQILAGLLDSLDNKSSMDEFVKSFEVVVQYAKETRDLTEQELERLENIVASGIRQLEDSNKEQWAGILAKVAKLKNGKDGKDGMNGKDGKDGYTPVKGVDYFDGKDGKDAEFDPEEMAITVVNYLETLEGDDRLDKSAIKGLDNVVFSADLNRAIEILDQRTQFLINKQTTTVSGSGAVDSVNGQTGVVVLDADDIDDTSTTNKFVTAGDLTKLSNLSGTNTGDQTISLTGDVTGSGTGSFAATITNNAVTLAKMADVASGTVFYRKTASTGDPEVQTLATLKTDLGLTGTNSGDQTSIVGITGTKAQFDTAVTDGNFLYVGDVTQYTDEMAQDAVGGMATNSTFINLAYNDATPSLTPSLSATGTPSASTFLRGDNTWATPAGSGDVSKVGTPVDNQVGVWTGDGTIEGTSALTFNGSTLAVTGDVTVSDEAYGVGWNGSLEVPTKNAVYDKIETLGGGGGITRSIVTTSGSATMGSTATTDYVYLVAGAHTMTLPTAVGNTNRYTVKNNHSAAITVNTTSSQTIDGTTSIQIAPEDSVDIISNNSNWFII